MRYLYVMRARASLHNLVVAAFLPLLFLCLPAFGQTAKLDDLFTRLKTADAEASMRIEQEIWIEWSKSGSPAMDLLLERGRQAMNDGATDLAIEHFTALIDHAPDFAEGWNARATAYWAAGDLGPAIADLGHALELNPRHFGALSGLGMIFEEVKRPQKALEVYRMVLTLNPHAEGVPEAVERLEAELLGQEL